MMAVIPHWRSLASLKVWTKRGYTLEAHTTPNDSVFSIYATAEGCPDYKLWIILNERKVAQVMVVSRPVPPKRLWRPVPEWSELNWDIPAAWLQRTIDNLLKENDKDGDQEQQRTAP